LKNWKLALRLFVYGYVIATVFRFSFYYLFTEKYMWIISMIIVPLIFIFLGHSYFKISHSSTNLFINKDFVFLAIFWVSLSFLLDIIVYVGLTSSIIGGSINWTFFEAQSPQIWIYYIILIFVLFIARFIYLKTQGNKKTETKQT